MPIEFTVELVAAPVLDDDWTKHYALLDLWPGTILIEDPIEPSLIFAFEAESDQYVYALAVALANLVGLHHTKVCVSLADRVDFEYADEDYAETH